MGGGKKGFLLLRSLAVVKRLTLWPLRTHNSAELLLWEVTAGIQTTQCDPECGDEKRKMVERPMNKQCAMPSCYELPQQPARGNEMFSSSKVVRSWLESASLGAVSHVWLCLSTLTGAHFNSRNLFRTNCPKSCAGVANRVYSLTTGDYTSLPCFYLKKATCRE